MAQSDGRNDAISRRQLIARGGALAAALLTGAAACNRSSGGETVNASTSAKDRSKSSPKPAQAHTSQRADGAPSTTSTPPDASAPPEQFASWQEVRDEFNATADLIHMSGILIATHPRSVRDAIERHREGLNKNPAGYLTEHWGLPADRHHDEGEGKAMRAAARYLDMSHRNIALVENTTTGLAMVYNGIEIREDQEVVSGHWNHWATEGSIDYRAEKTGFEVRRPTLFDSYEEASREQIVDRLIDQINDRTRIVAVTWVHSHSGLKMPIGEIGQRIEELNAGRDPADRILYCIDGVHGLGVEDAVMDDFHCDFFIAGCHKWLFGPRGTGIIAAAPDAWHHAIPTIPSFSGSDTPGRRYTPGGFHAWEHRWALPEAFEFHEAIGKHRVQDRIYALTAHLLEGLAAMDHVRLRTPTDPELTAGIVAFEVDGHGTWEVTGHLGDRDIVASTTPDDGPVPRLTPGLLNDHQEIQQVLSAVSELS